MPRARTDDERRRVRERLLATGRDRFIRLGLKKTTISDLARGAGIGKGSFYHFFDSKESLFLAVMDAEEAQFKRALVDEIEAAGDGRDAVVALVTSVTDQLERHPFLRTLLDPEVLAQLTLHVPPERFAEHREGDRAFFIDLARRWKRRGWLGDGVEPEAVFDVLAAVFVISAQRELLGADAVRRAVAEIAEAVADRWCA